MQKFSRATPVLTKARSRVMAALAIPVLLVLLAPAVQALPATHFVFTATPASAAAGTAFNFTVAAVDVANNVDTGYTGTVHFTSSDGAATLPFTNYTFTTGIGMDNGVHTFSATLKTAGNQTITATDTVTAINGTSNAILVTSPPTISKSFGAGSIQQNASTSLSFTISNPNGATALTGVGFTDNLPAGLVVATPNALTGSCGGGTITATAGSSSVTLTGSTLAGGASCTFSINVTATTTGTKTNTTSTVSSNEGGAGAAATATVTVNVVPSPPTISKTFGAGSIQQNASTSLSFTISNPNGATALTGVGFTDNLPAGLVVATPNALTGSCGGGTITATAGSSSVTLTGSTLAGGASCTFSINVTATTTGTKTNTTSTVSSNEGGAGAAATATVTVNVVPSPPTISKTFGAGSIQQNASTSLSFTITNPNGATSLTGVGFTDNLPAGSRGGHAKRPDRVMRRRDDYSHRGLLFGLPGRFDPGWRRVVHIQHKRHRHDIGS